LIGRGTDAPEQIDVRMRTAQRELEAREEFRHVIINDRLEDAVSDLEDIVRTKLTRDEPSAAR
jgi:guanylate kinase